jgi:acyl-CoA synthetase (AMP-forming)/AMP-acid ligase II
MPRSGSALTEPFSLAQLLARGLRDRPNAPALISLEGAYSWTELERIACRLAGNYLALGLEPGDRVASLMPNRIALIAHYLACFKAGLVMTPLNYRYTPPEIDHALQVSGARLILAHDERKSDVAASKGGGLPLGVLWYGAEVRSERSFEHLAATEPRALPLPLAGASDPAAIFFTSGSTGPAKGVTHTVGSLGFMFASVAAGYELTPADVMLPASSASHLGCFSFTMGALGAGARVAVARSCDHAELGPLMRATRPTVMSTLPATLLHLIREPGTTAAEFGSLRFCRSGGDKVAGELEREFEALAGKKIHEGYGMTEIGIGANNPPSGADKVGSIGLPNPGFAFLIRGEDGHECADGEEGRVWVSAPSLASGYWNDEAATAEVLRDGWLDTGDVMRADADGYLWFCGRNKQIIVHDGSNISPQEVEDALLEHASVANAGVVGIHDLLHGENVRAYVELKQGAAKPLAAELIAFARARVGYKAPEDIVFLDALPLNATGKVDRAKLKALAAGDHADTR